MLEGIGRTTSATNRTIPVSAAIIPPRERIGIGFVRKEILKCSNKKKSPMKKISNSKIAPVYRILFSVPNQCKFIP